MTTLRGNDTNAWIMSYLIQNCLVGRHIPRGDISLIKERGLKAGWQCIPCFILDPLVRAPKWTRDGLKSVLFLLDILLSKRLALTSIYLGSLYPRLSECFNDILRLVGCYDVVKHADNSLALKPVEFQVWRSWRWLLMRWAGRSYHGCISLEQCGGAMWTTTTTRPSKKWLARNRTSTFTHKSKHLRASRRPVQGI